MVNDMFRFFPVFPQYVHGIYNIRFPQYFPQKPRLHIWIQRFPFNYSHWNTRILKALPGPTVESQNCHWNTRTIIRILRSMMKSQSTLLFKNAHCKHSIHTGIPVPQRDPRIHNEKLGSTLESIVPPFDLHNSLTLHTGITRSTLES